MRILQICNKVPYPPKDGGSIATFNMSKGFAKNGHEVYLLCLNTLKHISNLDNLPADFPKNITVKGIEIDTSINPFKLILNYIFSSKPYIASRFKSKKYVKALKSILLKIKFDIVQIEGLYMCQYIPYLKKYSSAFITYRAHNIESQIWERISKNEQNIIKKLYIKNLSKRIENFDKSYINSYDALIAITDKDAEQYKNFGCAIPIKITPAGFDFDRINQINTKSEFLSLYFIGSLDWIPNQEGLKWFIKNVWPEIVQLSPELKLYIAGRNASDKFIKDITADSVIFLGEIDDANKFMASKSIMIVPLFSGSGMRVKIIEGMAIGNIVISTSIGAEGIGYTNKENILIANSAKEFKDSLVQLINNKELYQRIKKNARIFINDYYNNAKLVVSLLEFYKSKIST